MLLAEKVSRLAASIRRHVCAVCGRRPQRGGEMGRRRRRRAARALLHTTCGATLLPQALARSRSLLARVGEEGDRAMVDAGMQACGHAGRHPNACPRLPIPSKGRKGPAESIDGNHDRRLWSLWCRRRRARVGYCWQAKQQHAAK